MIAVGADAEHRHAQVGEVLADSMMSRLLVIDKQAGLKHIVYADHCVGSPAPPPWGTLRDLWKHCCAFLVPYRQQQIALESKSLRRAQPEGHGLRRCFSQVLQIHDVLHATNRCKKVNWRTAICVVSLSRGLLAAFLGAGS